MTKGCMHTKDMKDGGWGWVVCLASSWTNGVIFGIINSFGVLYVFMLDLDGATAFKTSWIGSVCAGLTFFMMPFASIITDKFGSRRTAVIGSTLALIGILASSFITRLEYMYITYGFAMGMGFAIAYQPSLYILCIYFHKRLGMANGLVCFGSAIFTVVLPIGMKELLSNHGLQACLWFQSSIVFVMLIAGLTYLPRSEDTDCTKSTKSSRPCAMFDLSIWKVRNYRIWAVGVPLGLFGYFVPFFHLVKHVNDILPEARGEVLIMCLGATSGVGRLVAGVISDHPKLNPIHIQQMAFLVIGVCTILIPVIHNFIGLCVLILVMGLFDGAFVSMMGLIAVKLVGKKRASQAIGAIFGLTSIPMMIGPPVVGIIYDHIGSYDIAFICSGIPPIIGACILFLMQPEPHDMDNTMYTDLPQDASIHSSNVPSNGDVIRGYENVYTKDWSSSYESFARSHDLDGSMESGSTYAKLDLNQGNRLLGERNTDIIPNGYLKKDKVDFRSGAESRPTSEPAIKDIIIPMETIL